ncbi:Smr/MutS family protein [Legionella worsleiensis]|uniref:Putative Smr domain protein n=1 Tax=Legionella worsleiensis TaxID=45076 RepID=A0A0W1AH65_9GAMM|nr:Smr/MutS family protein [Legionella worsleiensis]KTD80719.1 putative Smr domain protein [Legionella worsleiensis]STY32703.1 putative Smr domain protein [Legionella worsleiensis]
MADKYFLSDDIADPVFSDTTLSYVRPGVTDKRIRDLKNGAFKWDARLDVRGLKTEAARDALSQFITDQLRKNHYCVLIIHDKEGPRNTPPLTKNLMNCWLPQIADVIAFHSAKPEDGGTGAVYVVLKKATQPPIRQPKATGNSSFLVAETKAMERKRRLAEQQGERQLAPVIAREHSDVEHQASPEGELQNTILQHPVLDSQRFDGIDPNLNPEPPLNSEARREFDNERREQEKEKQLRLGNMPKFTTAPTPRGP